MKPKRFLLASAAGFGDLDRPFTDEIKEIPRITLPKNDLAFVQLNGRTSGAISSSSSVSMPSKSRFRAS